MGARLVFEPLHPNVPAAIPFHYPGVLPGGKDGTKHVTECYPYVRPLAISSDLDEFLTKVLRGQVSTAWTRRSRPWRRALRRTIVVKFVRGNLLASYVQRRFNCRTIFLLRHPAAVVASIVREHGGAPGLMHTLSSEQFMDVFLSQTDLVKDYLFDIPGVPTKRLVKLNTALKRIAFAYAVANAIPLRQLKNGLFSPLVIWYEDLVLNPLDSLRRLCNFLEIPENHTQSVTVGDSSTTKPERRLTNPVQRSVGWRNELSQEALAEIHDTCQLFGEQFASEVFRGEPELHHKSHLTYL
jgi:hypothetical protein